MKKLSVLALSLLATAAMAHGPAPVAEIRITGNSTQMASLTSVAVTNQAQGSDARAQQNLASNTGDVTISGNSTQTVSASGGAATNYAGADAVAEQNMSSNVGDVTISGNSLQATMWNNSFIHNRATGRDALAVQNIATNNACYTCVPGGSHHHGGH